MRQFAAPLGPVPALAAPLVVLVRTSLVHANLKAILCVQSAVFCGFAAFRLTQIFWVSFSDIETVSANLISQVSYLFVKQFQLVPGYVLFVERLIAIAAASNYDQWSCLRFSLIWCIPTFAFNMFNAVQVAEHNTQQHLWTTNDGILVLGYIMTLLSFLEIVAFALLKTHILKKYNERLSGSKGVSQTTLNERYQLAENIRIARQLLPVFGVHFASVLISLPTTFMLRYGVLTDTDKLLFVVIIQCFCFSANNLLIEYFLMSRHPVLRRNAVDLLRGLPLSKRLFCSSRVGSAPKQVAAIESVGGHRLELRPHNEMERHFQMLRKQWN